jgi:hypothetical protein
MALIENEARLRLAARRIAPLLATEKSPGQGA